MKDRQKEAGKMYLSALKNNLQARTSLNRAYRDASICRYEFIKLYNNKKFKLEEKVKKDDHILDV